MSIVQAAITSFSIFASSGLVGTFLTMSTRGGLFVSSVISTGTIAYFSTRGQEELSGSIIGAGLPVAILNLISGASV